MYQQLVNSATNKTERQLQFLLQYFQPKIQAMKWDISSPQGHLKHKYRTAAAFTKKLYMQQAFLQSKMSKLFLQTIRNINI